MTPETLAAAVVVILGKYAVDTGATMVKELGPKAVEAAKSIYEKTANRLRGRSETAKKSVDKFEKTPAEPVRQEDLKEELIEAVTAEPSFGTELQKLVASYEEIVKTAGGNTTTTTTLNVGSGAAVVGDNGRAYGQGASHIEGSTINYNFGAESRRPVDASLDTLPPVPNGLRDNMLDRLSRSEIRGIAFDLGVDYNRLPGDGLEDKVTELILLCRKQNKVERLLAACEKANSAINWRI